MPKPVEQESAYAGGHDKYDGRMNNSIVSESEGAPHSSRKKYQILLILFLALRS